MDILDYLEADLDATRSLIVDLRTSDEDSRDEAQAFTALVSLTKQQDAARELTYESVRELKPDLDPLLKKISKRVEASRELEHIIECCTNGSTWRASVSVYCELLENRIDDERELLLPAIFESIDAKHRRKLATQYRHRRGFVPKRDRDWQRVWQSVLNEAV